MVSYHSIERTSTKGPGQSFIGYCTLCGAQGLVPTDALKECPNPDNVSQDEALLRAIAGPQFVRTEDLVREKALRAILCVEADESLADNIQVCAGEWRKELDHWRFYKDLEWDE